MNRALLIALLLVAGCKREDRNFQTLSAASQPAQGAVQVGELLPGGAEHAPPTQNPFHGNAYAISEGQRLYKWFNCEGCHARGGGGIGPPLMDGHWIYGGDPQNIFATIVEGRPNGMPAFRGKIPTEQVWQIVAYVQSLSAMQPIDAVAPRGEQMKTTPAPNLSAPEPPQPAPGKQP